MNGIEVRRQLRALLKLNDEVFKAAESLLNQRDDYEKALRLIAAGNGNARQIAVAALTTWEGPDTIP